MAKKNPLPKRIYLKWEVPATGPAYLMADASPESMEHGDQVGIYELVEVRTMHVTQELK